MANKRSDQIGEKEKTRLQTDKDSRYRRELDKIQITRKGGNCQAEKREKKNGQKSGKLKRDERKNFRKLHQIKI